MPILTNRTKWKRQNNIRLDELRYNGGKSGPFPFKAESNTDSNEEDEQEHEMDQTNDIETMPVESPEHARFEFASLGTDRVHYNPAALTLPFGPSHYLQHYLPQ